VADPAIVFAGVNKWFGKLHVLRDIDLSIASGEVVVVCGPSGSGKSTLIRCVNALEPIQKGTITVLGESITAPGVKLPQLRTRVGRSREGSRPDGLRGSGVVGRAVRRLTVISDQVHGTRRAALKGRVGSIDRETVPAVDRALDLGGIRVAGLHLADEAGGLVGRRHQIGSRNADVVGGDSRHR
jgi:ABC-type cobalamin/Fe3+-siderophores transport system ATPase subunit